MGKVHTLILTAGYVENTANWSFIATNKYGFNSIGEALKDLAKGIVQPIQEGMEANIWRNCCKEATENNYNFCHKCGKHLNVKLSSEEVENTIYGFIHSIYDGTYDSYCRLVHKNWAFGNNITKFGNPFEKDIVLIAQDAEKLLSDAYHDIEFGTDNAESRANWKEDCIFINKKV